MDLRAHAEINLHLHSVQRRKDGYYGSTPSSATSTCTMTSMLPRGRASSSWRARPGCP